MINILKEEIDSLVKDKSDLLIEIKCLKDELNNIKYGFTNTKHGLNSNATSKAKSIPLYSEALVTPADSMYNVIIQMAVKLPMVLMKLLKKKVVY